MSSALSKSITSISCTNGRLDSYSAKRGVVSTREDGDDDGSRFDDRKCRRTLYKRDGRGRALDGLERVAIQMALTDPEASAIARAFAATSLLAVTLCESPPDGLYGFDPATEYLFAIRYRRLHILGASDYIVVSRLDGRVRFAGQAGE
jgi:hypothetical protein